MKNNVIGLKKAGYLLFGIPALLTLWIFFPMSSRGADADMTQIVSQIEGEISMPEGAHPLEMYDRYYARGEEGELKSVVGVIKYKPDHKGRVYILPYDALPQILDGGCNVIRIRYSILPRSFDYIVCNGEA